MKKILLIVLLAFIFMQNTIFASSEKERWYSVSEGEFTHTSYVGDPEIVKMTSTEAINFLKKNYPYQQGFIRYPVDVSEFFGRDKQNTKKLFVEKFSSNNVVIKVVQWKANEKIGKTIETIERYSTKRNDELDKLLSIESLDEKYTFEFNGIGQGASMEQVLNKVGAPDFVKTYQLMNLESWFYEKDMISIFFKDSVAKEIKKVDEEYIKMIKENYPTSSESYMLKHYKKKLNLN